MKTVTATLLLTLACCLPAPSQEFPLSLQMRLGRALEDARSISNIEVRLVETLWFKGEEGNPAPLDKDHTITNQVSYIASGSKYRTESHSTASSTNIVRAKESAFDGKLYSELKPGDMVNGVN